LKRVRLVGKRADKPIQGTAIAGDNRTSGVNGTAIIGGMHGGIEALKDTPSTNAVSASPTSTTIPIVPLTPEAFAPFGNVIQAYADHNAAPRGIKITPANQGTASKFHKLALLDASYPAEAGATQALSIYRCNPLPIGGENGEWEVKVLERHPFTTQAFIPMGAVGSLGYREDGLEDIGNGYLVVVAKNGPRGEPDLKTLSAFVASPAQGIMYNTAVWRKYFCTFSRRLALIFTDIDQPMAVFDKVRNYLG
jgi:allantoicase